MKKQYDLSKKARSTWGSHLTKANKRIANKSTRKTGKVSKMDIDADSFMFPFKWE